MGKSSQRKGAAGERELAALLRQYGYDIQRGGFVFGESEGSIVLPRHTSSPEAQRPRRMASRALNLDEAVYQSTRDSEKFKDGFPVVIHRKNHDPKKTKYRDKWKVTMFLDDWLEIYNNSDYPDNK